MSFLPSNDLFCLEKIIEKLIDLEQLEQIDLALTHHLLKKLVNPSSSLFFLCCYLSLAVRRGHLCIPTEVEELQANLEIGELEIEESKENNEKQKQFLIHTLYEAIQQLPANLFTEVNEKKGNFFTASPLLAYHTPLLIQNNALYFQRFWVKETELIQYLLPLFKPVAISLSFNSTKQQIEEAVNKQELLEAQVEALIKATQQQLMVICGGPGTGKTYTAGCLVKTLWHLLSKEQSEQYEIVLAAPTGKAAANLQKSLAKVIGEVTDFKVIKAQTLHSLLGHFSSKSWTQERLILSADLIIVDECSMIDLEMMGALLKSIKPNGRLVLLGDPAQLPSIGSGSIFADLVHFLKNYRKGSLYYTELSHCMRTDLKKIVNLAKCIHAGKSEEAFQLVKQELDFVDLTQFTVLQQFHHRLITAAATFLKDYEEASPEELFSIFNRFRILTPLKQGPYGTTVLNELFYKYFKSKAKSTDYFIAPIMITRNDSSFNLFNGDTGILVKMVRKNKEEDSVFHQGDYALFLDETGQLRSLPAILLPPFDYAYCLSIHKSQGSEFEQVLLLIPEGTEIFGREIIYTGVTRAKQQLSIWTSRSIFIKTVERQSNRLSGLAKRLSSLLH